jgi:hypothetical protein
MSTREPFQLTIGKTSVPVTHENLPLDQLELDPQNPRIRFLVQRKYGTKKVTAEQVLELVREQPGYDILQKTIRKAGGIHDAVIIRNDGSLVEGNTRVAVFKTLHEGNKGDARWKKIPVVRLPKDIPGHLVGLLMASYHVAGKNRWRAYAQADHISQLRHQHDLSVEQIADEVQMTPREVQHYLDAYDYLIKEVLPKAAKANGADAADVIESKFSHALEFMKVKKLEKHRNDPEKRAHVAQLLVDDKIKGAQVRKLHTIFESKRATKALKKGFDHAEKIVSVSNPIAGSSLLRKIHRLTTALNDLRGKDVGMFRDNTKARDLLVALNVAVNNVASVARVKMGARGG